MQDPAVGRAKTSARPDRFNTHSTTAPGLSRAVGVASSRINVDGSVSTKVRP
jgi:hypothetical protein